MLTPKNVNPCKPTFATCLSGDACDASLKYITYIPGKHKSPAVSNSRALL